MVSLFFGQKEQMKSLPYSSTSLRAWLFVAVTITCVLSVSSKSLRIGGFVSLSRAVNGWYSAGTRAALEMALEDVNRDPNMLPEYNLTVEWKDEKCGSGYSIKGLFDLLTKKQHLIAILGPGCSVATKKLALVSKFWNLIQIGFSSSDPILSKHSLYPNFYRVNPSENNYNPALKRFLEEFKWREIWILRDAGGIFLAIAENLNNTFNATINIKSSRSFVDPKYISEHIHYFKKNEARILYLLTYVSSTRKVLCEAYKQGFHGNEIQWILMGWYQEGWWKVNDTKCTGEEIKAAMGNYFAMNEITLRADTDTTFGVKPNAFKKEYLSREQLVPELVYGSFAYDAVWVLAAVLNKTDEQLRIRKNETLCDFNYSRKDIVDLMKEHLDKINITGVTGNIVLDADRNRVTDISISQFQGTVMVQLGEFQQSKNVLHINHTKLLWKGNKIPLDRKPSISVDVVTTRGQYYTTLGMAAFGITLAVAFLRFNMQHRNNEFIKMSSPPLNNIIIIGTIFYYFFAIFYGTDAFDMNGNIICIIRYMLASIGFSLAFGTMFLKTWRVYKIFTNDKLKKRIGYLSNKSLMMIVGIMAFMDFIYILVWNKVHQITCVRELVDRQRTATARFDYYQYTCVKNFTNYWFVALFTYKALLLIFGLFLAWQTRDVQLPGLNDSKLIALSVYNVVIFVLVLAPLHVALPSSLIEIKYRITSFLTIFCATVILLVNFVPKIYHLICSNNRNINTTSSSSCQDISAAAVIKNDIRLNKCPLCGCDASPDQESTNTSMVLS